MLPVKPHLPTLRPLSSFALLSLLARLVIITFIIAIQFVFASITVLPNYPYLRPLSYFLVSLSFWSLVSTLRPSSLSNSRQYSSLTAQSLSLSKCSKCPLYRLPRTHHCSVCKLCTPRFCHHCGVLGTCIGQHNVKQFVLLLIYGAISAILLLILCAPEMLVRVKRIWNGHPLTWSYLLWFQMYYLEWCLSVMIGGYAVFHLYLVLGNRTTLEACTFARFWDICPPWCARESPYNRGWRSNFALVFGPLWLAWAPVVTPTMHLNHDAVHLKADKDVNPCP